MLRHLVFLISFTTIRLLKAEPVGLILNTVSFTPHVWSTASSLTLGLTHIPSVSPLPGSFLHLSSNHAHLLPRQLQFLQADADSVRATPHTTHGHTCDHSPSTSLPPVTHHLPHASHSGLFSVLGAWQIPSCLWVFPLICWECSSCPLLVPFFLVI